MSETIAELRAMSEEQLIDNHGRRASQTVTGTAHYLAELKAPRRGTRRAAND